MVYLLTWDANVAWLLYWQSLHNAEHPSEKDKKKVVLRTKKMFALVIALSYAYIAQTSKNRVLA